MTQRFGLSPAEQQLFDVGLAQDEQAAFGVRPSAYAQLRQQQQPAPPAKKVAPPRARPTKATPRAAPTSSIASAIPGAVESFEEEAQLRKRNQALRRAFSVVPGGREALAAIDGLVEGSTGLSPRKRTLGRSLDPAPAPTMLKTVQREVLTTVGAPALASAVLVGAIALLLEDLADDGSPTVRELLGEENPDEAIPEILETLDQLERRLDELDPDGTLRQQLGVR